MAPSVRKFTFDLRFDLPEPYAQPSAPETDADISAEIEEDYPEVEAEASAQEKLYSEEDMEIAREEAYVSGHTSALEQASEANERALADALQRCADALSALRPTILESQQEIGDLATQVALEVCRKMLPHTADLYAVQEVEALIKALMPELAGQPRLIVRVHPRIAALLREKLAEITQNVGFEGKMLVMEDDTLMVSDTQVEWADGGAERNTTRLWQTVESLITRNIPHFSKGEAMEIEYDDASLDPLTRVDAPKETDNG